VSVVGTALIPPSLCINDSNQCAMIGVVARHPDAYTSESLTVGFPSKEVVALRGDPSPLPPHLPCPLSPKPFPRALAEVSGHINKVHSVHLFSYRLLAFRARGTKVEVQIADQEWLRTHGACRPSSFDMSQRFQVKGGNITPNDVKLDSVHH
jgi:hypothetical protein